MNVIEKIRRGDTSPDFDKQLRNDLGEPVDITNYQSVEFHMRDDNYNIIVSDDDNGNVTVDTASSGDVHYSWQSADTDTVGTYYAEFVVTFSDGSIETFPKEDPYKIKILEDIDD